MLPTSVPLPSPLMSVLMKPHCGQKCVGDAAHYLHLHLYKHFLLRGGWKVIWLYGRIVNCKYKA